MQPIPSALGSRSSQARAIVVGYGSIGKRHARVLESLGCSVAVCTRRPDQHPRQFRTIPAAIDQWRPDYVVVASRTSEHEADLTALAAAGFRGRVLVEKPLFSSKCPSPTHQFEALKVGYNMRFHPVTTRFRQLTLGSPRFLTAVLYVGQYLPHWRPGTDYRASYSAKRVEGGGVLRDLSHELDLANWLFGPWRQLTAQGGHLSSLAIDSDDAYSILMRVARCPTVCLHLNYLDRVARRTMVVNGEDNTIEADLVNGTVRVDGVLEHIPSFPDDSYVAQHRAMLTRDYGSLCGYEEGMAVLETIDAIESAATARIWIER